MAQPATEIEIEELATDAMLIPPRPAPTPDQAKLGIMPAAIGTGTYKDIVNRSGERPNLTDEEFEAFERAIAENRRMRRDLAEERAE